MFPLWWNQPVFHLLVSIPDPLNSSSKTSFQLPGSPIGPADGLVATGEPGYGSTGAAGAGAGGGAGAGAVAGAEAATDAVDAAEPVGPVAPVGPLDAGFGATGTSGLIDDGRSRRRRRVIRRRGVKRRELARTVTVRPTIGIVTVRCPSPVVA